jgi:hypothetical protein
MGFVILLLKFLVKQTKSRLKHGMLSVEIGNIVFIALEISVELQ